MACGCGKKKSERLAAKRSVLASATRPSPTTEQFAATRWNGAKTSKETTNG